MEQKIDKGLEAARKEKEKIIRDAEVESFKLLDKEKEKTDSSISSRIDKKRTQLEKEKEKILSDSKSEMDDIRNAAKKNKENAVDFVLELFNQRLDR